MNACMNAAGERYIAPRVNVVEREDAVVIEAEMPGIASGQAEVEVRDGTLYLKTQRPEAGGSEGAYRLRERWGASYYRAFELSDGIDPAKIEARMKDGVLTVTLAKSDKIKPRTVSVN